MRRADDRRADSLAKWLGVIVGVFTILGMLVGGWWWSVRTALSIKQRDDMIDRLQEEIRVLQTIECSEHVDYCPMIFPDLKPTKE